jgi:hypothetical protein
VHPRHALRCPVETVLSAWFTRGTHFSIDAMLASMSIPRRVSMANMGRGTDLYHQAPKVGQFVVT